MSLRKGERGRGGREGEVEKESEGGREQKEERKGKREAGRHEEGRRGRVNQGISKSNSSHYLHTSAMYIPSINHEASA